MKKFAILDDIAFILGSLLVFGIIYYKLPIANLQQISGVLLVVLLLLLNRLSSSTAKGTASSQLTKVAFLFLSSIFVQILVLATGNFFSPFLILIHLYSLGISFLVSLSLAMLYLLLSIGILIANIYFNATYLKQFKDDPGSIFLYLTSFIVIVPLSFLVSRYYRIKDAVLAVLNKEVKLSSQRQESLFSGVNELVFVTDLSLTIISANQAVERLLRLSEIDLVGKNLLEVITLKDQSGVAATRQSLSIERILVEKSGRIISDYFLYLKLDNKQIPIAIQIRPIADLEGEVTQLVFVLTDPQSVIDDQGHVSLEQARKRQKALADGLKKALAQARMANLNYQINLFDKNEDDLLNSYELEDHPIKEKISFEDIALICKQRVESKQQFGASLRVRVSFELPEGEDAERALIGVSSVSIPADNPFLSNSNFSAPVDPRWFKLLLDKLIDLSVLLSSDTPGAKVTVKPSRLEKDLISVEVSAPYKEKLTDSETSELFTNYYGSLTKKTNLKLGSGLEGFIVKTVASQLNIPIKVNYNGIEKSLVFNLEIHRQPVKGLT